MTIRELARELEGGCLCGATRYRVSGPVDNLANCHCRSCRFASGAPFVFWGTFDIPRFQTSGAKLVEHASSAKVRRGFCGTCGTALTYVHQARPGQLDVALATLDDPTALRPEFHIWVSEKLPWVSVDDLPAWPGWRERP
jgi:hypothetical protein